MAVFDKNACLILGVAYAFLHFSAIADEDLNYWTGGVDCSWKQKANWSKGTVPSSTQIAVFDVGDGETLRVTNGSPTVAGIRLTGGNLTLSGISPTLYGSGGVTGVVDVAEGSKILMGSLNVASSGGVVEKTGGGTLVVNAKVGDSRNLELVVSGGKFLGGGSGGASGFFRAKKTTIRRGGVLAPYMASDGADQNKNGAFNADYFAKNELVIEDGGVFDCRGTTIAMARGLSGCGDVKNAAGTFLCATNFTGTIYPTAATYFGNGKAVDDFVFDGVKAIVLPESSTPGIVFQNANPTRVKPPIRGRARIYIYNSCTDFADIDVTTSQFDIYNSFAISGGRVQAGPLYFKEDGLNITVTNGALLCGGYTRYTYNEGTLLKKPSGISNGGGSKSGTYLVGSGGSLTFYDVLPSTTIAEGGILRVGHQTSNSSTYRFDGGTYVQCTDWYRYLGIGKTSGSPLGRVEVSARGGRFVQQSSTESNYFYLNSVFVPSPGTEIDGGLSFSGNVEYQLYCPFGLKGPISLMGGTWAVKNMATNIADNARLLGTGSLNLGNVSLAVNSAIAAPGFARGAGSVVTLKGSSRINLPVGATQTMSFGDPAATSSALLRERGGVLTIRHDGNEMLYGETSRVKVAGGVPVDPSTGLACIPVFTESSIDVAEKKNDVWARRFYFAGYDDEKGFYAVTNMHAGLVDDASRVARVKSATLAADTTNSVAGLCIIGNSSTAYDPDKAGSSLTLSAGSVLRVGNGVDPAGVLMCSDGDTTVAAIKGAGTLDFGSSEGVVLINRRSKPVCMLCRITGSNGVTFAAPCEGSGSIYLGANGYSGGTWINGTMVYPRDSTSFGTGDVRTGLGNGISGGIIMGVPGLDVSNRLHLAGYGMGRSVSGALRFSASAKWSGDVELVEESRVSVYGTNTVGTLSGTVSGDRLQLFLSNTATNSLGAYTFGTLRLTSPNTYTGGTEIVRSRLAVSGEATLGTGPVVLDGGVLRIENDRADKTIPNEIRGIGRVELAGRGLVEFTGEVDSRAPEGRSVALDVRSRRAMVASLAGFSSVTSTAGRVVALNVLETTPFEGAVDPLVTILYGPQPKWGMSIFVR